MAIVELVRAKATLREQAGRLRLFRGKESKETVEFVGAPSIFNLHVYQPIREEDVVRRGKKYQVYSIYSGEEAPEGWNERLTRESYDPLQRIVGAFKNPFISCDIFPTISGWLQNFQQGKLWGKIEHDIRTSEFWPMADTGIHILMPEVSPQTQLAMFIQARKRYKKQWGRNPDFVFLPEMAVNEDVLANLVLAGFKGTLLRRNQVTANVNAPVYSIPTKNGNCLVFVSDSDLSGDLGFKELPGNILAEAIIAKQHSQGFPPILAVDAETIGHHKKLAVENVRYTVNDNLIRAFKEGRFDPSLDISNPPQAHVINGSSWSCRCFEGNPQEYAFARWRGHPGCKCDNDATDETYRIKQDLDTKLKLALTLAATELTTYCPEIDARTGLEKWRLDFFEWFDKQIINMAQNRPMSSDLETNPYYREYFLIYGMLLNGATSCSRFFGKSNSIEQRITRNNLIRVAQFMPVWSSAIMPTA